MFTGLVEEMGCLQARGDHGGGMRLLVSARQALISGLAEGDSIAVNGVCLTVTEIKGSNFSALVMPETLRKSNLGAALPGDRLNLERALPLGGRLGGHLVSGHIDATGSLTRRYPEGNALILRFAVPAELTRYMIPKGSIALDGVSLTIAGLDASSFSVSLIPLTAERTTLGRLKIGAAVNIEVDLVGKYVEKMLQPYRGEGMGSGQGLTAAFLEEEGFI